MLFSLYPANGWSCTWSDENESGFLKNVAYELLISSAIVYNFTIALFKYKSLYDWWFDDTPFEAWLDEYVSRKMLPIIPLSFVITFKAKDIKHGSMVVIINSTTIMDHTKVRQNSHFQKMIPVEISRITRQIQVCTRGMLKCLK